jgi:hypothetical protein
MLPSQDNESLRNHFLLPKFLRVTHLVSERISRVLKFFLKTHPKFKGPETSWINFNDVEEYANLTEP